MVGYYYYLTKIRPYFTQSERADYSLLTLTLITILIFGVLGLRPLISSTASAYAQLQQGKEYEAVLTEKILAVNQAATNFFSASNEIEQLSGIVPEGPSQPQVIQELDRDAGTAATILKSISFHPQEEKQTGAVGSYIFDLFATGTEGQLLPFLKELEKGQLLELQSLQTSLRFEQGGATLEVVARAKAFFIR